MSGDGHHSGLVIVLGLVGSCTINFQPSSKAREACCRNETRSGAIAGSAVKGSSRA